MAFPGLARRYPLAAVMLAGRLWLSRGACGARGGLWCWQGACGARARIVGRAAGIIVVDLGFGVILRAADWRVVTWSSQSGRHGGRARAEAAAPGAAAFSARFCDR